MDNPIQFPTHPHRRHQRRAKTLMRREQQAEEIKEKIRIYNMELQMKRASPAWTVCERERLVRELRLTLGANVSASEWRCAPVIWLEDESCATQACTVINVFRRIQGSAVGALKSITPNVSSDMVMLASGVSSLDYHEMIRLAMPDACASCVGITATLFYESGLWKIQQCSTGVTVHPAGSLCERCHAYTELSEAVGGLIKENLCVDSLKGVVSYIRSVSRGYHSGHNMKG